MPGPTRCEAAGFTLLEMMTVVGITAVMAGLAVASLVPLREGAAVRQGAEQVQQALQSARKRALSSGRCYRVDLLDDAGAPVAAGTPGTLVRLRRYLRAGCDFPAPPAAGQPVDADFEQGERAHLPQGVTAEIVGPPVVLDFLPTGRPRLASGETRLRLLVRRRDEQLWVDVAPPGAVCVLAAGGAGGCP